MIRPRFPGEMVGQHLVFLLLHLLLQGGLVIHIVEFGHRHIAENKPLDDPLGRLHAAIQEACRDDGFHRVRQDGLPLPSAALLLAVSQQQMLSQVQPVCHRRQGFFTHHIRPHPGQLALRAILEMMVQIVRHHHAQDGVPQKFQPLVAGQAVVPALVGVGGMSQGILQQRNILKPVSNRRFQVFNHCQSPLQRQGAAVPAPARRKYRRSPRP